jgi:hypothetical protein
MEKAGSVAQFRRKRWVFRSLNRRGSLGDGEKGVEENEGKGEEESGEYSRRWKMWSVEKLSLPTR